jgi:hypothetical protein
MLFRPWRALLCHLDLLEFSWPFHAASAGDMPGAQQKGVLEDEACFPPGKAIIQGEAFPLPLARIGLVQLRHQAAAGLGRIEPFPASSGSKPLSDQVRATRV